MDDEIIDSWCFKSIECFDSTSSVAIIVLVKNLESLSSLKSQQKGYRKTYGNILAADRNKRGEKWHLHHFNDQVNSKFWKSKGIIMI